MFRGEMEVGLAAKISPVDCNRRRGMASRAGPMRLTTCLGLGSVLAALLATGCKPAAVEDAYPARWHFAGSSRFNQFANAPGLGVITSTKSATAAGNSLAKRLTESLWYTLTGSTNVSAKSLEIGTPLMRELMGAESSGAVFEIEPNASFGICARIPANRVEAWRVGLTQFLSEAKGGDIGLFVGHTNGILTVAFPGTAVEKTALLAARLGTAEPNAVLDADVDFAKWTRSPWPTSILAAPSARLKLVATNQIVRTVANLKFPEPLKLQQEPWQLPTFLMNDLTRSFTAVRGIQPYLNKLPWFQTWDSKTIPNQMAIWMQPLTEFQTFFGFPIADGKGFMDKVGTNLAPILTGENPKIMGTFYMSTNGESFRVDDIPLRPPPGVTLRRTNDLTFVSGGFFQSKLTTNPVPAGLIKQLDKPGLVGYSWEITEESIKHWRVLAQLRGIVFHQPSVNLTDPGQLWLQEVGGKLGNAVTEIQQTAPNELTISRSGAAGLSGFELVALSRWIDGRTLPYGGRPRPRPGAPANPGISPNPVKN